MDGREIVFDAFTQAVGISLREMAGLEVVARGITTAIVPAGQGISAMLRLTSQWEGDFALMFPKPMAIELAKRIFADSGNEPDETMLPDCIGEVANVVAGQAKTLLYGRPEHFIFSTPVLMPESLPHPENERIIISLACEIGEFTLCLRLPSPG